MLADVNEGAERGRDAEGIAMTTGATAARVLSTAERPIPGGSFDRDPRLSP
jgi:hypothetical protein